MNRQSAGPLIALIDQVWDRRDEQREQLRVRVPPLQERARRTLGLALAQIGDRAGETAHAARGAAADHR